MHFRLGNETNESAILSIIKNDKRIVLFYTTPDRELIVRPNIDKSVYSANTGRVILAHYSPRPPREVPHSQQLTLEAGVAGDIP